MRICKKKQKKLKYKSDFLVSKIIFNNVLYFSIDGFNFNHSRTERFNLNTLYFSNKALFDTIQVIEVTKISDSTIISDIPTGDISMKVTDLYEIIILINKV